MFRDTRSTDTGAVAKARRKFKIAIRHHVLLKDSDHFDYDSGDSYDASTPLDKMQKLNLETCVTSKKTGYTLKLFDRTIDVAPFKEDAPLYPICREWIKADPDHDKMSTENGNGSRKSTHNQEMDIIEENAITELPAPEPLQYDYLGNPVIIRIPNPNTYKQLIDSKESIPIYNYGDELGSDEDRSLPSPAVLFQSHLDHWKEVKQDWKRAAKDNERRYKKSLDIFEGAYRDNRPTPH